MKRRIPVLALEIHREGVNVFGVKARVKPCQNTRQEAVSQGDWDQTPREFFSIVSSVKIVVKSPSQKRFSSRCSLKSQFRTC